MAMNRRRLLLCSLRYYWRTNLAIVIGVAIAVSVFSGALLTGRSVRQSLRDLFSRRLGATEYLVTADSFFHEGLADGLAASQSFRDSVRSCPIIYLRGVAIRESTGAPAYNVNIYGIDHRFWKFHGTAVEMAPEGRTAYVGAPLAQKLGIRNGEGILIRVETQSAIPRETLYGRRDNIGRTIRMTCGSILASDELGEFALRATQGEIYSVFVPMRQLQRDLRQTSRVNAILLAPRAGTVDLEEIRKMMRAEVTLDDIGAVLRPLFSADGFAVESTRVLLDDSIARAAIDSARANGMQASGIFTYLANSLRVRDREIPYSVITAADLGRGALSHVRFVADFRSKSGPTGIDSMIWLNEWAWRELGGAKADTVEVDYYLWQDDGRLVAHTARFCLAGVVALGSGVDAALAPDFPGITGSRSMSAWDPPFPLDLGRIRPRDEQYWNRYNATPKAFIALEKGQDLWQSRFGKLTAVRVELPAGMDLSSARDKLESGIRRSVDPAAAGFTVSAVKRQGLDASRGSTDFGEYFVYFSFFLIVAAILLSALFFRLGVEQRTRELGILRAAGFSMLRLRGVLLREGATLSICGGIAGCVGALGYAWLMVHGLRTWWGGAAGTGRLFLHSSWGDLGIGATAGVIASLGAIVLTLRSLRHAAPRTLLAGVLETSFAYRRRAVVFRITAIVAFALSGLVLLGAVSGRIGDVEGYFSAGVLLLLATMSCTALYLWSDHPHSISGYGLRAFIRFGARNAMHRPGRSLLCIALIASATFIIVSLEAFRQNREQAPQSAASGTGGYPLVAESALPVIVDPNSAGGREALGIPAAAVPDLAQVRFVSFRERSGDDASCLNLYAPQEPQILGAPRSFVEANRFSFQSSLASSPDKKANPWQLLESDAGEAVPAIGDANTIQYILHLSLGSTVTVRGDDGAPVRLRLVAALRDSTLQGKLIISEANFVRLFRNHEGYRFFLLDVPPQIAETLVKPLMEHLVDWGFNVESSAERLEAFHKVENTYLSAFQSLGALGLVLGTAGLGAVLMRNVLERRRELALLRAVGYRAAALSTIIVAENALLMVCGLACGTISALVAIVPALYARGNPFPAAVVGFILSGVMLAGLVASLFAVISALRSPLLDALRSE